MKKSSVLMALLLVMVACSKSKSDERSSKKIENDLNTIEIQTLTKEAEEKRERNFQSLLSDSPKDLGGKMEVSCVYFQSLGFQLALAERASVSPKQHDDLYLDVINEFTQNVNELFEKINLKKMAPTKTGKKHQAEMSFYALAACMNMNLLQDKASKNKNQTLSFYDIIKKSLLREKRKLGLDPYEDLLLGSGNQEIMIELIKARVDILATLAVRELTSEKDMTLGQKSKNLLFKLSGGRLGEIDLPEIYDLTSDVTKDSIEHHLEASLNARNFLTSLGIEKKLEKTMFSALKGIDFNDKKNEKEGKKLVGDSRKTHIRSLINGLLEN